MEHAKKAIVVGAGIAGMAASIRLAVQGYTVDLFEKNDYPGGKLSQFSIDGYLFDAGPSLFTQPDNLKALFDLAGEPMEDYFQYQSMPISFKYFYEDGTIVNAYTDNGKLAGEMEEKLGESPSKVLDYLNDSKHLYEHIASIFLNHSLHKKATLFQSKIFKAIKTLKWKYLFKSMHQVNGGYFTNPKTVQLFNRYATYNGSNPYKAPGMLSLIPHLELNEGTFYPKGGMISITNALYQLALKKGVRFHFNAAVQRIIQQDRLVRGVVVEGQNWFANLVVSNMDVFFTYQKLLGDARMANQVLKQERSSSALIFYWGINAEFPQLELHNIFFSTDYAAEFKAIFQTGSMHADPTVYVNITSKCEPGLQAPTGKENWFVMVNCPANKGQNWQALQQTARAAVIAKLNRILGVDLESLIEVEEVLDPVLIESKTASYMGSLYGTSSNSKMAAFLRHPNFSKALKGLYFVGGSVHPGGGIPLCLKSAQIMGAMVEKDFSH
ncbi:MAG: phytoene dehydrogenase [Chitinophagaceae bacterium BSSC1]|nr:MAG: phytoene dehydrogenase [Chitinophagaceae bacterium BSSC1]